MGAGHRLPACLAPLKDRLDLDSQGRPPLGPDFQMQWEGPEGNRLYAVNQGRYSHGIADSQLSLMCWRSARILNHLCQHEVFPTGFHQSPAHWLSESDEDWFQASDAEGFADKPYQPAKDELQQIRRRLSEAGLGGESAFIVRFLDDKRLRIHCENSMLHQALVQAGLLNAWQQSTNLWGFAPGSVADLGGHPEAWLIYVRPWPESDRERLQASPLWPYLPMARHDRIAGVGPVWTFGGVLSVPRMVHMLAEQLLTGPEDNR